MAARAGAAGPAASGRRSSCATSETAELLARAHPAADHAGADLPRADRAVRRARTRRSSSTATTRCSTSSRSWTAASCTSTSTTVRATSRAWRATTPRPTTGSSSPARPPCSATRPGSLEFDTSRLVRIGRPAARPAPARAARAERAPYRALRPDLGGRRGVQRLHLGRHRSASRSCGRCSPCPTCGWSTSRTRRSRPARRPRSATRTSAILAMLAEAARRDPAAGHAADHRRRHPRGDARLRRDDHRRLLGRPGLALPAHRASRSSSPTGTTTPSGSARRCRSAAARTCSTRSTSPTLTALCRGPARARRAPPRPGRDAAPLLRRPPGRGEHHALPGVGRPTAGRAPRPAGGRPTGRGPRRLITA